MGCSKWAERTTPPVIRDTYLKRGRIKKKRRIRVVVLRVKTEGWRQQRAGVRRKKNKRSQRKRQFTDSAPMKPVRSRAIEAISKQSE